MNSIAFWIGVVLNIIVGITWGVLGVVAIVSVYGVAIIWWMLGLWLIGAVLCYWQMFGSYLDYRKCKAANGD